VDIIRKHSKIAQKSLKNRSNSLKITHIQPNKPINSPTLTVYCGVYSSKTVQKAAKSAQISGEIDEISGEMGEISANFGDFSLNSKYAGPEFSRISRCLDAGRKVAVAVAVALAVAVAEDGAPAVAVAVRSAVAVAVAVEGCVWLCGCGSVAVWL
jgi:hypothetical protein